MFKAWAKRLTKLSTRVSLGMIFIMATVDTFTPTEITTWVIGSTASGPVGVNSLTGRAEFTKACGRAVNSLEAEQDYVVINKIVFHECSK